MTRTMPNDTTPTTLLLLFWRESVAQLRQIIVQHTADVATQENFALLQRAEQIGRFIEWMGSEENAHIIPDTPKFGEAMRLMPKLCFLALHGDLEGFDKFIADNEPFPIQG